MSECEHVNKMGLTTNYHDFGRDKAPEITCVNCNKRLTVEEYEERLQYVAKCYDEGKPYV